MRARTRSALLAVPMLALLTACDMDAATSPEPVVAPSHDYTLNFGTYQLVQTSRTTFELSNSKIIGPAGGVLYLGLHQLVVPRGAVKRYTRFTMTSKFGNNVVVDLTAVDLSTGAEISQFPLPLQLRLSYLLLGVPRSQAHRLTIVWLKDNSPDGAVEPVKTTLLPMQYYAVGWVTHFSQFAMAMN
ncbi:MAG: hypothetical protein WEE89_19695 [Gemmatimonadota bacterium]